MMTSKFRQSSDRAISALVREISTNVEFPNVYQPTLDFAVEYQGYNFLRKVRDPVLDLELECDEVLEKKAVSGFLDSETQCKLINDRKHPGWVTFEGNTLAPEAVLFTAERKIRALLGEFCFDEFAESIEFSNGASTRLPRRRAAVPYKLTGKPHVTRNCALLAINLIWYHEPWRLSFQDRNGRDSDPFTWVEVVEGSEFFTVPKTTSSVRPCCKEPELNMLCQKAIGSMLRGRLKRVRVDLNDQSNNRYLARCGSRTGSLSTIDLSAASDSMSLKLLELLPESWSRAIAMTRSESVKLPDGTLHTLSKISSMGNGFTFELESLFFWALASACCDLSGSEDRRIGIYGDDIIVHHTYVHDLIEVLSYCGFTTNSSKTHVEGPFRESCGGHYHYGVDVSPFFLRTDLSKLSDRYHLINQYNLWGTRLGIVKPKLLRYLIRTLLKDTEVNYVPPHFGTKAGLFAPSIESAPGVFFGLAPPLRWAKHMDRPWIQGYHCIVLVESSSTKRLRGWGSYLTNLLNLQLGKLGETLIPKGERAPCFKMVATSEWGDCEVTFPF